MRIHGSFECFHEVDRGGIQRNSKIRCLGVTDAVFARNRAAECYRTFEYLADYTVTKFSFFLIISLQHDIDVQVPVAGVSERRNQETVAFLNSFNQREQLGYA